MFWVVGNNKEELGPNTPRLAQFSTIQNDRDSDKLSSACWDTSIFARWLLEAQKCTHLGCCCRIPFIKSFASSLKWTKSGLVHEIFPSWIFRSVPLSFSPANGDLHVRLIYWTPENKRRQTLDFYLPFKWQKHKCLHGALKCSRDSMCGTSDACEQCVH